MDIAEKTLRLKQDFDDVFEAGKKAEYDVLWDGIQDYGNRTDYTQGFKNWKGVEAITPKYPIRAINLSELFLQCQKIKSTPMISCANADGKFQTCYCAFYQCYSLTSVDFDIANSSTANSAWQNTFLACRSLQSIKKIIVMENQVFNRTFQNCLALENITIEGTIGQNGFDIHWSKNLTAESIDSIVRALTTAKSGLTITLPVGAYNRHAERYGASVTEALWAEKRAYWSINELAV